MSFVVETAADLPEWWVKLGDKQEHYLRLHPQSKMHKLANQQLKERLAAKPKERTKLRSIIKAIASNPAKVLKGDFEKLDKAYKNVSKKDKEKIAASVKEAGKKGNSKKILKAITTTLAVAGLLTIGAGVIAGGGLPYAIIGARLFTDVKEATREIYARIKDGEETTKAVFNTVKKTINNAASDPKMLAAALIISNKKEGKAEEKKPSASGDKPKKEVKKQSFPKAKAKVKPKPA